MDVDLWKCSYLKLRFEVRRTGGGSKRQMTYDRYARIAKVGVWSRIRTCHMHSFELFRASSLWPSASPQVIDICDSFLATRQTRERSG